MSERWERDPGDPTSWPRLFTVSEANALLPEIVPLLIVTKLEQYDYAGATAIATVMLGASFLLLFGINLLQRWARRAEA